MMINSARPQPYLRQVTAWQLGERDAFWLDKAVKEDYYKAELKDVIQKAVDGIYTLWVIGNHQGIFVTENVQYGTKLILCVVYLAGSGFIENLDKVEDCFQAYGKSIGADSIQFNASRKGLQKIYNKRYTDVAKVYKMEIHYGE